MIKKETHYLTTAIAYPNSVPHVGHALEIVEADAIARFHKLLGKEVFFQTGTDEHGIKNWQTAKKEKKEIKTFLDDNVAIFKKLYKELNIEYDQFIRTTDKKIHHPGAIKLWKALVKEGDIFKQEYNGLYCAGCEASKTEHELENGQCPNHPTRKIESFKEENYFFRLSKYADTITKKIEKDEFKVIPKIRKNEILSFLKEAKDISFSRPKTSLPWGIEVPDDKDQVMYVWCDALSNYITGAGYGRDEKKFKKLWPANTQIIGKDILRFHAASWPAMLLSAKIDLPKELLVHGFILSRGTKMGKSTGNVIEPFEQMQRYGVDPFRWYLLEAMPLGDDGDYTHDLITEKVNAELVGNLSNFCYRVLSFTNKNFNSEITVPDTAFLKKLAKSYEDIKKAYEQYDFKVALNLILAVSAEGNKYFQDNEPWKLVKTDAKKAHKVISTAVNIAKDLSILLEPAMPEFTKNLQKQLKIKEQLWKDLATPLKNQKLAKAEIIFKRIEALPKEELFPLDLKVAEILEVKDHLDADKLLVLKLDLGEKRQIVAGLKGHYSLQELPGKKIIVVANLEPAKLRGVESQAMLLAATDDDSVEILETDAKPGDTASFGNLKNSKKQITFKDFLQLKMLVKNKEVFYDNKRLEVNKVPVNATKEGARIS